MPAIGYVTRKADGSFEGRLNTLSINASISIVPNRRKARPEQPDYRVYSGAVELGGGWIKTGERSNADYVSLGLAAPEFGRRPIYANLGRAADQDDENVFAVIWNPED